MRKKRRDALYKSLKLRGKKYRLNLHRIFKFLIILFLSIYFLGKFLGKNNLQIGSQAREKIKDSINTSKDLSREAEDNMPDIEEEKIVKKPEKLEEEKDEEELVDLPENIGEFTEIALAESDPVDKSYFDDAVFLGNSRTEMFIYYTGLSNATSYAYKGFSIDKVFEQPIVEKNSKKLRVIEALEETDFSKAYLMFGYNETGWHYPEIFIEKYGKLVDEIRRINPEAIIYIQSILPVSKKASEANGPENNERIYEYNKLIAEMVEEKDLYFLNVGEAVSDEEGCLNKDASSDGIHLNKDYAEKWLDYLKRHTSQ